VKKTWFPGLALTLGVSALPAVAMGQYSIGNSGSGLTTSSFNTVPAIPVGGSGVRSIVAPPAAPANLASYPQHGAVGSGIADGHIHVAPQGIIENPVLNSQYQAVPTHSHAAPVAQPYEQMRAPVIQQDVPSVQAPTAAISSCPACNSGNCATHGVGASAGQFISPTPSYSTTAPSYGVAAYGSSESCYASAPVSVGPSAVSPSPWIFGAGALVFNRFDDDVVTLTTNTQDGASLIPAPNPYVQSFLRTSDSRMEATGGFQTSIGRYFCDGRYAIIGSYWGIFENPQTSTILASDQINGNLRSNLPFTLRGPGGAWQYGLDMPAQSVYDWYDGSFAHRLVRDQQFHNIELNFFSFALGGGARQGIAAGGCGSGFGGGNGLRRVGYGSGSRLVGGGLHGGGSGACGSYGDACGDPCQTSCEPCAVSCSGPTGPCAPWYGAQCSKLRLNLFSGIRWFRFKDSLEYASSENDGVFNGGADDFYYRNGVTNDLLGFQLGTMAHWCCGSRFNLFGGTSFGIYGNHMQATTFAGTTTQTAAILSPNTAFDNRPYDYDSNETDVAFLGEGTLGTGIRISRGWSANIGYRVVGVSGVASAIGQIPRDFARGDEITRINNNNSLILHGLVLGAAYNF
jgi:hypothetical protein